MKSLYVNIKGLLVIVALLAGMGLSACNASATATPLPTDISTPTSPPTPLPTDTPTPTSTPRTIANNTPTPIPTNTPTPIPTNTPAPLTQSAVSGDEIPADVRLEPQRGDVGDEVTISITIPNPFSDAEVRNLRIIVEGTGSIAFLPDTFQPAPSNYTPGGDAGTVAEPLIWEGLTLKINDEVVIRGQGRITGPREFRVEAKPTGQKVTISDVEGEGAAEGIGAGIGVTASFRDDRDSIVVPESFNYIIEITGQGDNPQPFTIKLDLPDQVVPLGNPEVNAAPGVTIGRCSVRPTGGAEKGGIDCEQSKVSKGATMVVTVKVQAKEPGPQSLKFAVKAKLTISYPEMGGIEESDEEITVIYSGK